MTHLEALVLGLDATLDHTLAKSTHRRHRVVENLVAEVAGTTVQSGHLRNRSGVGRLQTLVGSHAHSTTSGGNQNHIGTYLVNSLLALLETLAALGGRAIVKTHMQMHNRGTGIHRRFRLANDLFYSIRYSRVLLFRDFCSANSGCDNQFFHIIFLIFNYL